MSLSSLVSRLFGGTSVPALEHDEFCQLLESGACHVIDVREPHEYAAGRIPGAVNHPLSSFDPARLPTDKPVVLVCQAGGRSARALAAAKAAGHVDINHYAPGTGGWRARGGAIAM